MSDIAVSVIVLACVFAGGVVAMLLSPSLPDRHRSAATRDIVRLGTGMISVLASLVLGLLTASSQATFHEVEMQLRSYAADLIQLDQFLRDYGAETAPIRKLLLQYTDLAVRTTWPEHAPSVEQPLESPSEGAMLNRALQGILSLSPSTDNQRWLRSHALDIAERVIQRRWSLLIGQHGSISPILIFTLAVWITAIFAGFGLDAPRNATVVIAFFLCAASIGTSVFLLREMDAPFTGVIKVSAEPMENALAHLRE